MLIEEIIQSFEIFVKIESSEVSSRELTSTKMSSVKGDLLCKFS